MRWILIFSLIFVVSGCKITASAFVEHKIDNQTNSVAKIDFWN